MISTGPTPGSPATATGRCSSIPFNLALVTAGFLLGENYEAVSDALSPYEPFIYLIVGGGILFVLIRWIRGRGSPPAPA
jgi:membrane protein DedA with SNARE-associated domain